MGERNNGKEGSRLKILYTIFNENRQFGIKAIDVNTSKTIALISNISVDKNFVESLVYKFNTYELSILHFKDAVEDTLE